MLEQALSFWEKQMGDNTDVIIQTKGVLASVGTLDQFIEIWNHIIQARLVQYGPDHWKTLRAIEDMAGAVELHVNSPLQMMFLGSDMLRRYIVMHSAAADLWRSLVLASTRRRGPLHPDTITAIERLAGSYQMAWSNLDAVETWEEAISRRKETQGLLHASTLNSLENLAKLYQRLHRYNDAEDRWKEIKNLTEQKHGSKHLETLRTMTQLAMVQGEGKRYTEATALWRSVIYIRKEVQGASHEDTLNAMEALATLFTVYGSYAEAGEQWKEVIDIEIMAQAPNHSRISHALTELAESYANRGQYVESVVYLQEAVNMKRETQGPSNKYTLLSMCRLAYIYLECARFADAADVLEAARENDLLESEEASYKIKRRIKQLRAKLIIMQDDPAPKQTSSLDSTPDMEQLAKTFTWQALSSDGVPSSLGTSLSGSPPMRALSINSSCSEEDEIAPVRTKIPGASINRALPTEGDEKSIEEVLAKLRLVTVPEHRVNAWMDTQRFSVRAEGNRKEVPQMEDDDIPELT